MHSFRGTCSQCNLNRIYERRDCTLMMGVASLAAVFCRCWSFVISTTESPKVDCCSSQCGMLRKLELVSLYCCCQGSSSVCQFANAKPACMTDVSNMSRHLKFIVENYTKIVNWISRSYRHIADGYVSQQTRWRREAWHNVNNFSFIIIELLLVFHSPWFHVQNVQCNLIPVQCAAAHVKWLWIFLKPQKWCMLQMQTMHMSFWTFISNSQYFCLHWKTKSWQQISDWW